VQLTVNQLVVGSIPPSGAKPFRFVSGYCDPQDRSEVTLKGGSLFTERPLAMRERSWSGSGWRVCEICGATQEMIHYKYRRGMQSIMVDKQICWLYNTSVH